jgi:2-keto-4-pentenoate hydratase
MFADPQTREARVAGAAALLADIRRGRRDKPQGLPASLQPSDQAEAEAVQLATYAALGWKIGGWKVGRSGSLVFAAPLPDVALSTASATPLRLPLHSGMELECALRLKHPLEAADLAALTPSAMPDLAELVMLFELVESRFAPGYRPNDLEKVADCVSHGCAVFGPALGAWTWPDIEQAGMRLQVDGIEVAAHAGSHRAMPLDQLVEAWRDRCIAIGHLPQAGEVVTLGSLTGLLPVPAAGGVLQGELAGRAMLECRVAPLGAP